MGVLGFLEDYDVRVVGVCDCLDVENPSAESTSVQCSKCDVFRKELGGVSMKGDLRGLMWHRCEWGW
jgi:hypothetical protein